MFSSTFFILILSTIIYANKPIPNLSSGFSGVFTRNITESTTVEHCHISQHSVHFNPNDQRAQVNITSIENDDEEEGQFWFIKNPSGSPSNFFGKDIFVLFENVDDGDESTVGNNYCSYSSYFTLAPEGLTPGSFPSLWQKEDGCHDLSSWYSFPETMVYSGKIVHKGVEVDLWVDSQHCTVFKNIVLPCNSLATLVDQSVPVFVEHVHQKRSHSFEEDWIQKDEWQSYTPSTPTITPPTDWTTKCYNTDNGFDINPSRAFVATPSHRDSFTISLTAPPPTGTTVRVCFYPNSGCTYCAQFEKKDGTPYPELEFTEFDWSIQKKVYIRYLSEGEVEYSLHATGGGYGILNWESGAAFEGTLSESLRVLTCENGVHGFGCF